MRAPIQVRAQVVSSLVSTLSLLLVLPASGCAKKDGNLPGAKSPEAQSDAEYDVARDLFFKGQPRAALDHAQKAIELNEGNARAVYFTGAIYLSFCSTEQGLRSPDCRLADAEKMARRAVAEDDGFRDARNMLGQVLILQKKFPEAITVLEPLTRDPAYTESHLAWGNLGWAQVQAGQVDQGIASLENAITQPNFCVGHYRLGVAWEKKGDLKRAEQGFTAALGVDTPDCKNLQDAWEARARVRQKLGRPADARIDYQRCRDISTESETGRACVHALAAKAAPADPPTK
jgi:Tfp pilus assembly protein PilF